MENNYGSKTPWIIYGLGGLCLIPIIGVLIGAVIMILGIFVYKDKWLTSVGAAGILFTFCFVKFFDYQGKHAEVFLKGFDSLSQIQLNKLVGNVEYYKLQHGQYPDSLAQLTKDDPFAPINDPVNGLNQKGLFYFNYWKVGKKYVLFSSGRDRIPYTKDDLFPKVTITDSSKIGLVMPARAMTDSNKIQLVKPD